MSRMNVDELLDQIVIALREAPVPDLAGPLPMATPNRARKPVARSHGDQRFTSRRMKNQFLMAGAALAALLTLGITVPALLSGKGQGTAFAEVQRAVTKFRSVRYRILDFQGDKDPYVTKVVWARGLGSRVDQSGGSEQITNLKAQRMLWLNHGARSAKLYQMYFDNGEQPGDTFVEKVRSLAADAKPIGTTRIDGKDVLQFRFTNWGEYVVLVDPDTKLPLRMELKIDEKKGRPPFREVITDFIFDAPVDESAFEQTLPPGYAVERCEEPQNRKPIDTKTLVVSPARGIGALPMGASKEQVVAVFGKPDWIELQGRFAGVSSAPGKPPEKSQAEDALEKFHYNSLGFNLDVSSVRGVTQFHCLQRSLLSRPFLGKTDAGLSLGASIDDVVRAYGPPEVRSHFRNDVLHYPHKGWSFVFADGKLAWYSASEPLSEQIEIEDNGDGSSIQRVKGTK